MLPFRATTRRRADTRSWMRTPLSPRARRGGLGLALTLALFTATGFYGSVRGGQYADFVQRNGSPFDLAAKLAGFPIDAITIAGIKELDRREILAAAAIDPSHSLLLLDVAAIRDRLKALPLVRDAVVTKLFPDRLTITIDERDPVALWQSNGKLSIVSSDGVVIDSVRDDHFVGLPFVVGEGANTRVAEFLALLDTAGDLRGRVTAGIYVGEHRWDIKMDNGVVVKLPETGAPAALARLAGLDKQARLLDKDVIAIDMRVPNRLTVRLSAEAAAARAEMLAKRPKHKGTSE